MSRSLPILGLLLAAVCACGPVSSVDRARPVDARPDTGGAGGGAETGGASGSGGQGEGGAPGTGGGTAGAGGTANGGAGGAPAGGAGGAGVGGGAGGRGGSGAGGAGGTPVDLRPDLAPDLPPAAPVLAVSSNGSTGGANLTANGSVDWMHFGLGSASTVNRKRLVSQQLSMQVLGSGSLCRYTDRPVVHSWTDGTPTLSASSVPDGVCLGDVVGRGFEIRAPASVNAVRTLKVYVGAWGARARLTAQMSSGSGYVYTDRSLDVTNPGGDLVYTAVYQASGANQTLILRWTIDTLNHMYGNVTLQAVTLSE